MALCQNSRWQPTRMSPVVCSNIFLCWWLPCDDSRESWLLPDSDRLQWLSKWDDVQTWTLGRTIQIAGGPLSYRKISRLVIRKRWEEGTPRLDSRSSQRQSFTSVCRCMTSFHRHSDTLLSELSSHQGLLFTLSSELWECGGMKSLLLLPLPHAWSNTLDSSPGVQCQSFSVNRGCKKHKAKILSNHGGLFCRKNCCTALQISAITRNLNLPITHPYLFLQ